VINDHAIAGLEAAAALAGSNYLAAWLVAGDHALVSFGTFAEVLVIDAANVGAADGGGFDAEQHLSVAWSGDGHGAQFDGRVSGQEGCGHGLVHCVALRFRSGMHWIHRAIQPFPR
jgi:hypothetical protein